MMRVSPRLANSSSQSHARGLSKSLAEGRVEDEAHETEAVVATLRLYLVYKSCGVLRRDVHTDRRRFKRRLRKWGNTRLQRESIQEARSRPDAMPSTPDIRRIPGGSHPHEVGLTPPNNWHAADRRISEFSARDALRHFAAAKTTDALSTRSTQRRPTSSQNLRRLSTPHLKARASSKLMWECPPGFPMWCQTWP